MENSLMKELNLRVATCNCLKKSDYVKIATELSHLGQSVFNLNVPCDVLINVNSSCENSSYSIEEFKRSFSSEVQYSQLVITTFIPKSSSTISYHLNNSKGVLVYINSHLHTPPELDDILQDLIEFISKLYQARVEDSYSQETAQQIYESQESNTTEPTNHKTPFYQSIVFWTAVTAISTLIGVFIRMNS